MSEYWAHSGGHLLASHLQAVALLAAEFSKLFDSAELQPRVGSVLDGDRGAICRVRPIRYLSTDLDEIGIRVRLPGELLEATRPGAIDVCSQPHRLAAGKHSFSDRGHPLNLLGKPLLRDRTSCMIQYHLTIDTV